MRKGFIALMAVLLLFSMSGGALARERETVPDLKEAKSYAYLDMDKADAATREKILNARNEIINNTDWTEDGSEAYVVDIKTGKVLETLPHFSEVFPEGWEPPVYEKEVAVVTDGEGSEQAYSAVNIVYNGDVKLSHPSSSTVSSPFCTFVKQNRVVCVGATLIPGSTYNVGLNNATTGVSVATKTNLNLGEVMLYSSGSVFRCSARASTYSTPGWAKMQVIDGYEYVG